MLILQIIFLLPIAGKVIPVGVRALNACKDHAQSMLECQNILHPERKVRVPIDLLLYPHMVLVGYGNITQPSWKCSGSLISAKWVMTAAHCAVNSGSGRAKVLKIGTATLDFDETKELVQERLVGEIIRHPNYEPPLKYHDIALMRPERDFILSRYIRIACLHFETELNYNNATAIGFGTTQPGASTGSQTLMKVELDIIDNTICNRSMRALIRRGLLTTGITENQLCAGDYEKGGRDTCQGDSGGPLQVMADRVDCKKSFPLHIIIGVTSFGRDCGRKKAPGVYTRVSKYIDWIESVVWPAL
ncbi:Serine protease snake [Eumeta japonica]|uniref:Serine protease snake n=1 Tax=Eumeta variegata TaxID=151549 RepID=A0A4C1TYI0_EUMVA|nr:Serine protease snake [Eumeta japonica]